MISVLVCTMALGISAPVPVERESAEGRWRIDGNGFEGILEFKIVNGGKILGTIYGQPIEGNYNESTNTLTFKRKLMVRGGEPVPVQEWTGTFTKRNKNTGATFTGTYKSVAGPDWGKEGFDYTWKGVRLLTPEQELESMKGEWVMKSLTGLKLTNGNNVGVPDFIRELAVEGGKFRIDGNRLKGKDKEVSLTNEIDLEESVPTRLSNGHRLVVFTLPSGKGILASYIYNDHELVIHYPKGCTAGTGTIMTYKRSKN